nr:hypothetical protein [Tanacetum cinerariifolium]
VLGGTSSPVSPPTSSPGPSQWEASPPSSQTFTPSPTGSTNGLSPTGSTTVQPPSPNGVGRFKIKKKRKKTSGLLVFEAREIEKVERLGAEKGANKGFSVFDIEGCCDA